MQDGEGSRPDATGLRQIRDDLGESGRAFIASFRSREFGRAQLALFAFELTEWAG